MVTPAIYEDAINDSKSTMDCKKMIEDTVTVLKQFGYDSGAEVFKATMFRKLDFVEEVKGGVFNGK